MSIASYNQFQHDVMQDSALQKQLKTVAATSPEKLGEVAIKLGAERGYSFTLEDIRASVEASSSATGVEEALKDEELEMVSGGVTWLTITPAAAGATIKVTGEVIKETASGEPTAPDQMPAWRVMKG